MNDVNISIMSFDLEREPKLSTEEKQLAKLREHQRRKRKEKLYSYPETVKSRNI
jgi:hypothetical protein